MGHDRKISVTGLGYVGLPVAVAFAREGHVIAFDVDEERVAELRRGHDRTLEVSPGELEGLDLHLTSEPMDLGRADFHIIAVPTPIDGAKRPDLDPLLSASRHVGAQLERGDIVVYESTVYPGATEEECVPVLEQVSGLRCGPDFRVGYSPERINPGDRDHTFARITKVVAGQDAATLEIIAAVYESVVTAGVHRAPSIQVAEAAKVIENTQRDLNIALMNELALIFNRLGIDTWDVLTTARTKWNFLQFEPGLVGGHCIGVDPYYLTHKATTTNYHPEVILSGRRINDGMGAFVADQAVKMLFRQGYNPGESQATVLGFTFKENVPDLRNTRVIDIVTQLQDYGLAVQVHDPLADPQEARHEFGIALTERRALRPARCVILAVDHEEFVEQGWAGIQEIITEDGAVVMDVKGMLSREHQPENVWLWRL